MARDQSKKVPEGPQGEMKAKGQLSFGTCMHVQSVQLVGCSGFNGQYFSRQDIKPREEERKKEKKKQEKNIQQPHPFILQAQ